MRSYARRSPITLLEVMIVILLIGLIGGVLSYNLKGTLDRGKQFRSEEGIRRLKEILDIQMQQGLYTIDLLTGPEAYENVKQCVEKSGFIPPKAVTKFLEDGWKEPYSYTQGTDGEIEVSSRRLEEYKKAHPNR